MGTFDYFKYDISELFTRERWRLKNIVISFLNEDKNKQVRTWWANTKNLISKTEVETHEYWNFKMERNSEKRQVRKIWPPEIWNKLKYCVAFKYNNNNNNNNNKREKPHFKSALSGFSTIQGIFEWLKGRGQAT